MTDLQRAAEARRLELAAIAGPSQRRAAGAVVTAVRGSIEACSERTEVTPGEARVVGYASTTEQPYEMYDMFGPYTEVVSRGAFTATLARSPLVEFTVNHGAGGGIPMAHTRNGTLMLREDPVGLYYEARVDPARADVADVLRALERGDLAESSFKFRIDLGMWSPDFTTYRIELADLERGDVSTVNFGANPTTTSALA
jgi:HK97 family phage prohead protease